jgi:hypothetical protein
VPLSHTGAELLFEIFSQCHDRRSTIVTSNLHSAALPDLRSMKLTGLNAVCLAD